LGPRIVPIVADEARTFGMANLFKQVGIYSSVGQRYAPEDIGSVLSYREALDGQILEEGISEAGAIASWTAAATSYSVHGLAMLPFYIYYSMFGFQRVGDAIWAAADQRARGFLLGATSGRTTLGGEGLQHQDGSSHLVAATIPNCKAYDPAFAGEMAVIIDHGMREMLVEQRDVFYYVTLMNENYAQPDPVRSAAWRVRRKCLRPSSHGNCRPAQAPSSPPPTMWSPCPNAFAHTCRRVGVASPWAPMALAAAIRGRLCAATLAWTRRASCGLRWRYK
jgi:pyruvate dehydrogenase E1 component